MPIKVRTTSLRHLCVVVLLAFASLSSVPPLADPTEDDPLASQLDPDYAAAKAAIKAKEWKTAIARLSSAALRDTKNADIQNFLGYAHRQLGEMDAAFRHYERALKLNPELFSIRKRVVIQKSLQPISLKTRCYFVRNFSYAQFV